MEEKSGGDSLDPSNRWGTVRAEDCPQLFPYYVEQFCDMMAEFPSMASGTLEGAISRFTGTSIGSGFQLENACDLLCSEVL